MTSRVKILASAAILIFAFALTGCSAAPASNTDVQNPQTPVLSAGDKLVDLNGKEILANKLTVSATGTKKAMPDVAYVTAAVTTQNKVMKKAQSDNREKMNALYAALKDAGLSEDDIRTVNYSAYPLYDYSSGRVITGYQVTNSVELTIRDIEAVGDYIDIAAEKGANTNYSINFGLLDNSGFYNEALAEAVTKAKAKADTIAAAGGYNIIGTLEISESQGYYSPQYAKYDMAAEEAAGASTPVTAGLLEITANVTIVYQIQ